MAGLSLEQVLRTGLPRFLGKYRVRLAVWNWANSVLKCRTAALGGHRWHCPEGHESVVLWNSCKHRACPKCAGLDRARWLEKMQSKLALDCGYHHVIFTVPWELNELWQWNRSWFADQVLGAARETLLHLLGQDRWLGALPGVMLSWHTWGRNLSVHPHVHAVVTAGGWTETGWKALPYDYLVPTKVLREVFRGKLQARLRSGLSSEEMVLPAGQDRAQIEAKLSKLYRKEWCVRVQPRYRHAEGVMDYLGRYVRGGPLREHQLLSLSEAQVTFRHLDYRDMQIKALRLPIEDFLFRLSEHVPDPGFHTVRYAGLYATCHRSQLSEVRSWLGRAPVAEVPALTAQDFLERMGRGDRMRCSHCGRRYVQGEKIERQDRGPPDVLCRLYREAA